MFLILVGIVGYRNDRPVPGGISPKCQLFAREFLRFYHYRRVSFLSGLRYFPLTHPWISSVVFPAFLFPAVLLGLGYYQLSVGYLNTGRDLRRMESNTRSPIYSDFGELLEGIVTVRAFSAERRFLDNLHLKIDVTTKVKESFHHDLLPI